jgi:Ca2+-binding RTX toxin-like protein
VEALHLADLFETTLGSAATTCAADITALQNALDALDDPSFDGDGDFSITFGSGGDPLVIETNATNSNLIDVHVPINVSRNIDEPLSFSQGDLDLQGGALDIDLALQTVLDFQLDKTLLANATTTDDAQAFYLVGEPEIDFSVDSAATIPAPGFRAIFGFTDLRATGSANFDIDVELDFDDPDDNLDSNGNKRITVEEMANTLLADLVDVRFVDNPATDAAAVNLALDASIIPGSLDASVAFTDADLSVDGGTTDDPQVTLNALDRFDNITPEQAIAAVTQLVAALAGTQNATDPKLPFLQNELSEAFSVAEPLTNFLRRFIDANVVCGTSPGVNPGDSPSGSTLNLKTGDDVYCRATADADPVGVTWSSTNATVTNGTSLSTIGTAPSANAQFDMTSDGDFDVEVLFEDAPGPASGCSATPLPEDCHKANLKPRTAQELFDSVVAAAGLDTSSGNLQYDATTSALTYRLRKMDFDPAQFSAQLDFGDQLQDAAGLIGLNPDVEAGAGATIDASGIDFDVTLGFLLVENLSQITAPEATGDVSDRFFIKTEGSGPELEVGDASFTANLQLDGQIGPLEIAVQGAAGEGPPGLPASGFLLARKDTAAPLFTMNIATPTAPLEVGSESVPNAILISDLLGHLGGTGSYLSAACNAKMAAGLSATAAVGGQELASGGISIRWDDVFGTDCVPDPVRESDPTSDLEIDPDADFADNLNPFDIPVVTGTHNGPPGNASLVDTTKNFLAGENLLNLRLKNKTTGAACTILTVTGTDQLDCTLSGGTRSGDTANKNLWLAGDEYEVVGGAGGIINILLDNLELLVAGLEQLGVDTDKEIPLINLSTKDLVKGVENIRRTLDEMRGVPVANVSCGTAAGNPPTGDPTSVLDGSQIFCQAQSTKDVTAVKWEIARGGTTAGNIVGASGTHTGDNDSASLVDSAQDFSLLVGDNLSSLLVGTTLQNVTDGSSCLVTTAVGTDTLECTLAGGTDNNWDTGDAYEVGAVGTVGTTPSATASFTIDDPDSGSDPTTELDEYQIRVKFVDDDGEHSAGFPPENPPASLQKAEEFLEDSLGIGANALKFELFDAPASGRHNGSDNASELTDANGKFIEKGVTAGYTLKNVNDGSSCSVTARTPTTVTCTLAGGTENDWDAGDSYVLIGATGTHTGAANVPNILTDSAADFVAEGAQVGHTLKNMADGSRCTITARSATTLTCVLQGGAENDWDTGEGYQVFGDSKKDLVVRLGYGVCTDADGNATTNDNPTLPATSGQTCEADDELVPKPNLPLNLDLGAGLGGLAGLQTNSSFQLEFAARASLDVAIPLAADLTPDVRILDTTGIDINAAVESTDLNLTANVGPLSVSLGTRAKMADGTHTSSTASTSTLTDSAGGFTPAAPSAQVQVGALLKNTTDNAQCVIKQVTSTTLSCDDPATGDTTEALSNGGEWNQTDAYVVQGFGTAKLGATFSLKRKQIDTIRDNESFTIPDFVSLSNINTNFGGPATPNDCGTVDHNETTPQPPISLTGDACARLSLQLGIGPSTSIYLGDVGFRAAEIENPDDVTDADQWFVTTPPDLIAQINAQVLDWAMLLQALPGLLTDLEHTLDGAAQNVSLPLIGPVLDGGADVVNKINTNFVTPLAGLAAQLQGTFDADGDGDSADPWDISRKIQDAIFGALDPPVNLLQDGDDKGTDVTSRDVTVTPFCGAAACADGATLVSITDMRVTFELGQGAVTCDTGGTCVPGVPIPFDLGLKGLPFRVAGELNVQVGWSVLVDFGLSRADGPYLVTKGPAGFTGTHDGADDALILTDSTKNFTAADKVEVGSWLENTTDASFCRIVVVAATTLSCDDPNTAGVETLAEGTDNHWDATDDYRVHPRHGPDAGNPEIQIGGKIGLGPGVCDATNDPLDPNGGAADPDGIAASNWSNRCFLADLGFLQVRVRDGSDTGSDANPNNDQSELKLGVNVNLKHEDAAKSRLTFSDFVGGKADLDFGFDADANVDLRIRTGIRGGQAAGFPSVLGTFHLGFDDDAVDPLSALGFKHLYLDAGTFITKYLKPIADEVRNITSPFMPFIEFLQGPLPVVSDLSKLVGGGDITLIDIIEAASGQDLSMVRSIIAFVKFATQTIDSLSQTGLIALGSGGLGGFFDVDKGKAQGSPLGPDTAGALISAVNNAKNDVIGSITGASTADVDDRPTTFGVPGLSFPFMSNATQIFGVLMGKDVTLVRYDVGTLRAQAGLSYSFPPIFIDGVPVEISIFGSIEIRGRFALGYDTLGLRLVLNGASGIHLFDGIFIDDLNAQGQDVPEITLIGTVGAEGAASLFIIKVGISLAFVLTTTLDLDDRPEPDGKLRIQEIFNKLSNPICLFVVSGKLEAVLSAFVEIDLYFYTKRFTIELVRILLLEFEGACDPPNPDPATPIDMPQNPGTAKDLRLNMGDFKSQRGINVGEKNEKFTVRQIGPNRFSITAFGAYEEETIDPGGKIVVVDSDNGNDVVSLEPGGSAGEGADPTTTDDDVDSVIPFTRAAIIQQGAGADEIRTGDGNDTITAGPASTGDPDTDKVLSGAGNDTINGGDDDDVLTGGPATTGAPSAADDTINGGEGGDTINGGQGADTLNGGGGDDIIAGGPGNGTLDESGSPVALINQDLADTISGGPGNDSAEGNFGNDVMYGDENLGNPALLSTCDEDGTSPGGNDSMNGGPGNDKLFGGNNSDALLGNEGDDLVCGNAGNDSGTGFLDGDDDSTLTPDGNDEIHGGDGNDRLFGRQGHDRLFGDSGVGNDVLFGGEGPDDLIGGDGRDILHGEAGNDILLGDTGTIDGHTEAGHAGTQASVHLLVTTTDVADASSLPTNCNVLIGPGKSDCLFGGDGNDYLFGESGRDHMRGDGTEGAPGTDYMEGNGGGDLMRGGQLDDLMHGNAGTDEMHGDSGNDRMLGGADNDTMRGGIDADYMEGNDSVVGLPGDQMFGDDGADRMVGGSTDTAAVGKSSDGSTADGSDTMFGGAANDVMAGDNAGISAGGVETLLNEETRGGADEMRGEDGMDRMFGELGGDTMFGGLLDDYMEGNADSDTMRGEQANDDMIGGGDAAATNDAGETLMSGGDGVDVMTGDNASITRSGSARNVKLLDRTLVGAAAPDASDAGDDTMDGDAANDVIYGQGENDDMSGGLGDDYMEGNTGSDFIEGDAGFDKMIGGSGLDQGNAGGAERELRQDDDENVSGSGDEMHGGADIDYMGGDNAKITGSGSGRQIELYNVDFADDSETDSVDAAHSGNDEMHGGNADDVMYGQGDDDDMFGDADADYMEGNAGSDLMEGNADADDMVGGSGQHAGTPQKLKLAVDENTGGAGTGDDMYGNGLSDLDAADDADDHMAGDNAFITRDSNRAMELYDVAVAGGAAVPGAASGDDLMHGNGAEDLMYGQGDQDEMFGDDAFDYMEGNAGRDRMEGNAADDDMVGGSGQHIVSGVVVKLVNSVDENVPGFALAGETDGDQMWGNGAADADAADDTDDYMAGDNAFITRNSPREIELYDVPFADGDAIDGATSGDDYMHGNGDTDVMYGQGDNDEMYGDGEDDYMEGNSHDDFMEGNADEDDMLGGSGHDNADDTVDPADFRELRNVRDGRDTMFGNSEADLNPAADGVDYMGGDNANILRAGGTKNFDVDEPSAGRSVELYDVQLADGAAVDEGVSGGDTIEGNAGNDVIFGQGNGSQLASQADPDDDIDNDRDGREDGNPSDAADRGYDCNDGAADTTVFLADPDNDGNGDVDAADPQCQAATDEDADWQGDLIHGNDGHDYIEGNHGSDWMFGDGGEDDMAGGGSADDGKVYDAVTGDPIADRTAAGLLDSHDVMWGNAEDDSVVGDNGAHTRPTDAEGAWTKDSGGNGFNQFERTMTMSQSPEDGAAHGNDYLRGNDGNDDMFGQLGDDYMQGDADEDAMLGDLGQVENQVIGGTGPGSFIDINPPFIEEYVDVPGTLKRVVTLYAHNTDVAGAGGGADTMLGNEGNDKMHGGPGPDLMQGNGDTPNPANASTPPGDFLFGGDGDDALWGGRGHDHLFGGWGNDFHDVAPRPYMDLNGDTVSDVPQDLPVWFELAGVEHNQGLDFTWGGRDKDAHQASFGRPGPRPGDRLIDAVGNTNIFYTCPGAYGEGVINRDELMPDMRLFLQELAAGDGAVETLDPNSSGGRELSILYPGDESGNPPYPGSPGHFTCPPSDPSPTSLTLSSQQITAGDQVTINAVVGNEAPAATGAVVVRFAVNGVEIGRQTVEGIEEGGTETASQVWNTRNLHGPQRIDVTIDPDNALTGENEENNTASLDATVTGTDAAIAPADVKLSRAKIVAGDKVDVSATVRNPSSAPAYDVVVRFTDNGALIGKEQTIASIPAGGSATTTVRWRTNKLSGAHTVAATADPANAIAETDESNNAAGVVANVIANKVKNGVFEPSVVTPTAPDAWTAGGTATTYVQVVDDECDWLPGAGSSSYWMSEVINGMTPGAPYEVGVRVRGGLATLAIKQYTEAGRGLKTVSFVLQPPAGEWFEFENTVTLDSRATQVQLLFYGGLNGIPSDFCNAQLSQAATATATR